MLLDVDAQTLTVYREETIQGTASRRPQLRRLGTLVHPGSTVRRHGLETTMEPLRPPLCWAAEGRVSLEGPKRPPDDTFDGRVEYTSV